jgi:hypothetical protein
MKGTKIITLLAAALISLIPFGGAPEVYAQSRFSDAGAIVSAKPGNSGGQILSQTELNITGSLTSLVTTPMIAAGNYHTIGLKSDGTVIAVGSNQQGQCNVSSWTNIVQVATAATHTVGLKSDGTVVAVGQNDADQTNVGGWTNIVQIAAGFRHTVGLKSDGTVVAVGYPNTGLLDVADWKDIVQVAAGEQSTLGLKADGTVVSRGSSGGNGWTDIVHVAAGVRHSLGVKSNGKVVAAGENGQGQCNVGEWTDIVQVTAGYDYTVGLKGDGTLVGAGLNDYGQIDFALFWAGGIVQVSAGTNHTVGLMQGGSVVSVGNRANDRCNVGTWNLGQVYANTPPNKPVNIAPVNGTSGTSLTPVLQSTSFSDSDSGNIHAASQWQITTVSYDYTAPVFDSLRQTTYLTQILLPPGKLNPDTQYYWHVRHSDNHLVWSEWSADTSFTTGIPVDISVILQGATRPGSGWNIPLTVKFFTPGAYDVNATPIYTFNLITVKAGSYATAQCSGVTPGNYDITAVSEHTLLNVKRNVTIISPINTVNLGTLLEGNANNNDLINIQDFGILATSYGKSQGQPGYNPMADFDRNDIVNIFDFGLLATNYLKIAPIEVP